MVPTTTPWIFPQKDSGLSPHTIQITTLNRMQSTGCTDGLITTSKGGCKLILSVNPPANGRMINNWLPVPKVCFKLILRANWPEESLFTLEIKIPSLKRF
jgi:hypothetical protein